MRPRRLVALKKRCPDAIYILAGLAARENGPKVWNAIKSKVRLRQKTQRNSWQKYHPGYPPWNATVSSALGVGLSESVPKDRGLSKATPDPLFTVCVSEAELPIKLVQPLYIAVMVCAPEDSFGVVKFAAPPLIGVVVAVMFRYPLV